MPVPSPGSRDQLCKRIQELQCRIACLHAELESARTALCDAESQLARVGCPDASPPQVVAPPAAAKFDGGLLLWRATVENLASRILRRLEAGLCDPAIDAQFFGVLDRCETAASKVGDGERRMQISPTLEAARVRLVKTACRLAERGCAPSELGELLSIVGREREVLKGPIVDAEMKATRVADEVMPHVVVDHVA